MGVNVAPRALPCTRSRRYFSRAGTLARPWIADLRDPWALDEMTVYPTSLHRRLELKRMRDLLGKADGVVMNTPEAARRLVTSMPELGCKTVIAIPNGWESADFAAPEPHRADGAFRIVHTGNLHTELGRVLLSRPQGDPASESKLLFERACNARIAFACAALKVQYGATRPVTPTVPEKQAPSQACVGGNNRACLKAALLDLAAGNKTIAQPSLIKACATGDAWACKLSKP